MKIREPFKEDINNSLKEIQFNTGKQVKKLNKSIQNLKVVVKTIKETQMQANLKQEKLGKRSGIIDISITNRIKEKEERITVEETDITVKENSKHPGNSRQNIRNKSKNNQNRGE